MPLVPSQLIYLQRHQKSYIHAIFGPTDVLLFPGVDKLITSIDLAASAPTFTFTSKRAFLPELQLTEDQFLDTGILVGCEHSPSFPPSAHEYTLKATVDMVKYYKTGNAAVCAFAEHPGVKMLGYHEHFARTKSMIKFSLILTSEGAVQPLPVALSGPSSGPHHHPPAGDVPQDLHEIFTNRLPDEVFFYLSRGLLSPQPLVWLTSGQILEPPPLDNGETTEYRRFVKEVVTDGHTGPRATSIALISNVLNQFWNSRRIAGCFWFDPPSPPQGGPNGMNQKFIGHHSTQTGALAERVAGWLVPYAVVEEELRRQNVRPESRLYIYYPDVVNSHLRLISHCVSAQLLPINWRDGLSGKRRRIKALMPLNMPLLRRKMRLLRMSSGDFWNCEGECALRYGRVIKLKLTAAVSALILLLRYVNPPRSLVFRLEK